MPTVLARSRFDECQLDFDEFHEKFIKIVNIQRDFTRIVLKLKTGSNFETQFPYFGWP